MGERSHLATILMRMFATGELSGAAVQRIAHAAWRDGRGNNVDGLPQKLAKAGQWGIHAGNIARDIFRAAKSYNLMSSSASPYEVTLSNGHAVKLFLPHELFYHKTRRHGGVADFLLPEEDFAAEDGLGSLLRDWATHRDVDFQGDPRQVVALGLHCDGVQYTSTNRAGGVRGRGFKPQTQTLE